MTDAEIVQAVGATNLKRTPRRGEPTNDFYTELVIPVIEIGRYRFDVKFAMAKSSDRLVEVLIGHVGELGKAPIGAFEAVYQMLKGKFGPPARMGTSETWVWTFPTTTVFLVTIFDPELEFQVMPPFVVVQYVPTSRASASEKLSAF